MEHLDYVNPIERNLVDKATRLNVPITANLEITPYCNLHCDMCYVRMSKKEIADHGGLLPLERWLRIAEELKTMGTLFILLTGGEPLLYPYFKDLYIQLRNMGFVICLNTNATMITEDIAQLLKEHKPRRVNVTLYGGSNETYRKLCHVQNGYDKSLTGLKLLKRYGIDSRINLTILKSNQDDYESLLRTADNLGITAFKNFYMSVFCRDVCTSQLDVSKIRMSPKKVAQLELDYLRREKGDKNFMEYIRAVDYLVSNAESFISEGVGLDCRAGKSSCWINWQGIMTPCVDMIEPKVSLLTHTVSDGWNLIVNQCKFLQKHMECKGCKLQSICDVCYANATNEKKYCGNIDYLCSIAEEKQKLIKSYY